MVGLASPQAVLPLLALAVGAVLVLLTVLLVRHSSPTPSVPEALRWGFLIMLPAATIGSAAAWPTLRTLSAFRVLYIGLTIGALAWLLLRRKLPLKLEVGYFICFLAFWLAWAFLSLTWAADKATGIKYLIFLAMMISLTTGTVVTVSSTRWLRTSLLMLWLTLLLAVAIGLLEITTDFRLPTSGLRDEVERAQWAASSFFRNQNDFATYIALWMPFLLASLLYLRRPWLVAALVATTLPSIVCLLYTGSRANLLALALVVASLLLVIALRRMTLKSWRVILSLAVLCGVVLTIYLGMSGSLPLVPLPEVGVQHWQFGTLGGDIATGAGSGASRLKLITNGLLALRNSYLLGVGPGNAEYHLQRMPGTEVVYNLHNWWMEVLVTGGVFVFAGYVVFYGALLYNLLRIAVRARDRILGYAGASLFAALVGYSFGALAPSSAIHFTPMWIHFGLGLAVINLYRRQVSDAQG